MSEQTVTDTLTETEANEMEEGEMAEPLAMEVEEEEEKTEAPPLPPAPLPDSSNSVTATDNNNNNTNTSGIEAPITDSVKEKGATLSDQAGNHDTQEAVAQEVGKVEIEAAEKEPPKDEVMNTPEKETAEPEPAADSKADAPKTENEEIPVAAKPEKEETPMKPNTDKEETPQTQTEPPPAAAAVAKETDAKKEQEQTQYSTRGRHSIEDIEKQQQPAEEPKEITAPSVSFLDALGEEERRVRTRFVPEVDGFSVLFKAEVKSDLHLARSVMSNAGSLTALPSSRHARKKAKSDDSAAGGVEDDAVAPSEDELSSETCKGTDHRPSRAFLPPPVEGSSSTGGGGGGDDMGANKKSPHTVEAATAYNPPRPPESVGAKKKHRMLRWERRPQDVEIDLTNYRKTVEQTRKELQMARAERERIETVSCLLRCHFFGKLTSMNEEGVQLNQELGRIQSHCVKAADLLQSRTRSRGVGKGSYVMKDVLNILKQRGAESSGDSIPYAPTELAEVSGIGGVDAQSFVDWDRSTQLQSVTAATSWILPGNTVKTPYGEGTVVHIYGADSLDPTAPPAPGTVIKSPPKKAAVPQHGFGSSSAAAANESKSNGGNAPTGSKSDESKRKKKGEKNGAEEAEKAGTILVPRVCVKLPFGFGFFPVASVTCKEDPSMYSDAQLEERWRLMMQTAQSVAGAIEVASREDTKTADKPLENGESKDETEAMDIDDESKETETPTETVETPNGSVRQRTKLLPLGCDLLPTSVGRGTKLETINIVELEAQMEGPVFGGEGVLGKRDNQGVTPLFREWEDQKDELSVLRAEVFQRRNELARQKRIRALNEKTLSTTLDRTLRAEALVSEMRADLKSLKDRLDCELEELGIDWKKASNLLESYYKEQEETEAGSVGPRKRQKRPQKEVVQFSPKQTRRRAADSENKDEMETADERKRIASSDDDMDHELEKAASKRSRPNQ